MGIIWGMILAGLTGNYGMGKSSVAAMFRDLGAVTLDCDEIVSNLLTARKVLRSIRRLFGDSVFSSDRNLDRAALAEIIFSDSRMRLKLEGLLHPMVLRKLKQELRRLGAGSCIVVVEIPLLFEGDFGSFFDRTITVHTAKKIAVERLKKSGICRRDALARLNSQMDIREKKRLADFSINNNGTRRQTASQARKIYALLAGAGGTRVNKGQHLP